MSDQAANTYRHVLAEKDVLRLAAELPASIYLSSGADVEAVRCGLGALLQPLACEIATNVRDGPGLLIVGGDGLDRLSDGQLAVMHIALGLLLGTPMPQNARGERLVLVRDRHPATPALARGLATNERMLLHTDGWDAAGLLCLGTADSGGDSIFASAARIHARIAREAPDLLPLYHRPWSWNVSVLRGCVDSPPSESPIFSEAFGSLSCRYGSSMLRRGPSNWRATA